jgi:hypothetical protein
MKPIRILIVPLVLILASCYSTQTIPISFDEPVINVYEVDGTKDELFLKANLWMVATFTDPRSIIQYSDKAEGVITGKYLLKYIPFNARHDMRQYVSPKEESIYALIEIRIKDSRALISIKPEDWNYYQTYYPNKEPVIAVGGYTKDDATKDMESLCESFYQRLKSAEINF